jgi:hypothetical protein
MLEVMGWNLQTWLLAILAVCGLLVYFSGLNLRIEGRKIQASNPPLEFNVMGFEDKVQKHKELKRICSFLALFCILTLLFFA